MMSSAAMCKRSLRSAGLVELNAVYVSGNCDEVKLGSLSSPTSGLGQSGEEGSDAVNIPVSHMDEVIAGQRCSSLSGRCVDTAVVPI
jgi:hypothetical protein